MTELVLHRKRHIHGIIIFLTLGNHDPEGGLKIRKIYKKLGMSSNLCRHDSANYHAKEPH